jgi:hypothetical protein
MPPKQSPNNFGSLLNLERVPPLAPKFTNQIGKTCAGFRVEYTMTGTLVKAYSTIGPDGADKDPEWIGIQEWERRRALRNAPSVTERLNALRRKYELRLNRAFPAQGPASGSEEDIQAWLGTLAFAERRALLMSQKDFAKSYPDGFRA